MRRFALGPAVLAAVASAAGCFYTDPINERPSLSIALESSPTDVYRGDLVQLRAIADDPEHAAVDVSWAASACTDARVTGGCAAVPFYQSEYTDAMFTVPGTYLPPGAPFGSDLPVKQIFITLSGTDALGADARPGQQLVLPVLDAPPTLELRKVPRYAYVVGTAIDLYAKVGDVDDGPLGVTVDWEVFSPSGPAPHCAEFAVPTDPDHPDPSHMQYGCTVVPSVVGHWSATVTATDPVPSAVMADLPIEVVADHAPCIAQWSPIVATGTAALPISDDTLFSIPVVTDDLDPYPSSPGDPVLGTTAFAWSILPPGAAAWQPLVGTAGNSAALAHDAYAPGSIVSMRVEIADRNALPVACDASQPTCSVISDPTCIQRQTWRVELH